MSKIAVVGSSNTDMVVKVKHLPSPGETVLGSDFVGSWTREDDLVIEGLQFEDGCALVPDKAGLGCELDMDALERYRVG